MTEKQQLGNWGEALAAQYLIQQGLKIITTQFHSRFGEIDLIAKEPSHLVFVEVRVRHPKSHGDALESITPAKRRKIRRTAEVYLQTTGYMGLSRIDVIGIDTSHSPAKITWIRDAC